LNKLKSTKISAVFLAAILVAGTIATISPSFMTNAQAISEYGKDSYKSKDSSSVFVKKINCNNINVNVNGLEITVLPPALSGLLTDEAQAVDEGQYGSSSYGSGEGSSGGGQSGYDNNSFKFVCINNNNNTVIAVNETTPQPQQPKTCEECFTHNLSLEQVNRVSAVLSNTNFTSLQVLCEFTLSNPTVSNENKLFLISNIFLRAGIPDEDTMRVLECLDRLGLIILPS